MQFIKVCFPVLIIPLLLGVITGFLYNNQIISDHGKWIDTLEWVTEVTLHKPSFVFEYAATLYVIGWAFLGKLTTVFHWSKWFLIKCCIGITVVPVFILGGSYHIPEFRSMLPQATSITIMGYALAWAWYYFLGTEAQEKPNNSNSK